MNKVNVFIISSNGSLGSPSVISDNTKAEAFFDSLVENLLPDFNEENKNTIDYGFKLINANIELVSLGIKIYWYEDIEII